VKKKSGGEGDADVTSLKYQYHDETWENEHFVYEPTPKEFTGRGHQ
jgi:hypothetical protein